MAFAVEDFQDLLRLLDEHPQWQAELRRRLLTDELLELPALFRQLTERVDALAERMNQLAERMDQLAGRMDALTARVEQLAEAQVRTEQRIEGLTEQIKLLVDQVGDHAGRLLEWEYSHKYQAYFGHVARRLRALTSDHRFADLIDDAVDDGRLTMAERDNLIRTDIVMEGKRRDGTEVYVAVEVSRTIDRHDIERVLDRADLLIKLGRPVLPVVAGAHIDDEDAGLARSVGVWLVQNGRTQAPNANARL